MRSGAGYLPVESKSPLMGLNGTVPSTQVNPSYSPDLDNVFIRENVVYKRPGYNEFVVNTSIHGIVMAIVDFELVDATRILVLLTSKRQYKYNGTTWVDITTRGTFAITGVSVGASGYFQIAGDHTALFIAGFDFTVIGSTGNNGSYVVVSSALNAGNTRITVASVPNAVADGSVSYPIELTTIEGDYIDWVVGTDQDSHLLYMTNGRDKVRTWDGSAATFVVWVVTYPNFITCKTLTVFFDHLMLGNLTFSDHEPKVVAWSDTINFDSFTTGDSGQALIPGISGQIWKFEILGDRLIVYASDSIASIAFVGVPQVFIFEVLFTGTRLVAPRGVCSFGPAHLFASQDNLYYFDGTRGIRPVGDPVRTMYKSLLNYLYATRMFVFNDVSRKTIFVLVPTSSTQAVMFVLDYSVYDLNEYKWTKIEYIHLPYSMGFFLRRTGRRWVDANIEWVDDTSIWANEGSQQNFPVRMMGTALTVMLMDEISASDNGTRVEAVYETIDFVVPQEDQSMTGRWLEFEADLRGVSTTVSYSVDQGVNWVQVSIQELTTEFSRYKFDVDVTARTIRFKFSSTDFFALRWLRAWVRPASPR